MVGIASPLRNMSELYWRAEMIDDALWIFYLLREKVIDKLR